MAAVGFNLWPDQQHLPRVAEVFDHVDYVEVVPETLWGPGGVPNSFYQVALALAQAGTPIVAHGVGIDPASTDDARRRTWLERYHRDALDLGYRWVSDHLGTTSAGGEPVALPLPAPESFARLTRTLDQLSASTGAPAGIENSAWYAYNGQALDEPARLADALGERHHLVLDLHNLWTNSVNLGFDPLAWLDRAPLDRVIELHLSGGTWAPDAWTGATPIRLDSHDSAVPDEVWDLLDAVVERCPGLRGATLERIEGPISPSAVKRLIADLARLRTRVAHVGCPLGPAATPPAQLPAVRPSAPRSPREVAHDRALARLTRSPTTSEAGEHVAHRLIVKLRFSRLLRGDDAARQWFDDDPQAFVQAFRAFHQATPCQETPWDEARAWRAHRQH